MEQENQELHTEFIGIEKKLQSSENFIVYDSLLKSIDLLQRAKVEGSYLLINTIYLSIGTLFQTANSSLRYKICDYFRCTVHFFPLVFNKDQFFQPFQNFLYSNNEILKVQVLEILTIFQEYLKEQFEIIHIIIDMYLATKGIQEKYTAFKFLSEFHRLTRHVIPSMVSNKLQQEEITKEISAEKVKRYVKMLYLVKEGLDNEQKQQIFVQINALLFQKGSKFLQNPISISLVENLLKILTFTSKMHLKNQELLMYNLLCMAQVQQQQFVVKTLQENIKKNGMEVEEKEQQQQEENSDKQQQRLQNKFVPLLYAQTLKTLLNYLVVLSQHTISGAESKEQRQQMVYDSVCEVFSDEDIYEIFAQVVTSDKVLVCRAVKLIEELCGQLCNSLLFKFKQGKTVAASLFSQCFLAVKNLPSVEKKRFLNLIESNGISPEFVNENYVEIMRLPSYFDNNSCLLIFTFFQNATIELKIILTEIQQNLERLERSVSHNLGIFDQILNYFSESEGKIFFKLSFLEALANGLDSHQQRKENQVMINNDNNTIGSSNSCGGKLENEQDKQILQFCEQKLIPVLNLAAQIVVNFRHSIGFLQGKEEFLVKQYQLKVENGYNKLWKLLKQLALIQAILMNRISEQNSGQITQKIGLKLIETLFTNGKVSANPNKNSLFQYRIEAHLVNMYAAFGQFQLAQDILKEMQTAAYESNNSYQIEFAKIETSFFNKVVFYASVLQVMVKFQETESIENRNQIESNLELLLDVQIQSEGTLNTYSELYQFLKFSSQFYENLVDLAALVEQKQKLFSEIATQQNQTVQVYQKYEFAVFYTRFQFLLSYFKVRFVEKNKCVNINTNSNSQRCNNSAYFSYFFQLQRMMLLFQAMVEFSSQNLTISSLKHIIEKTFEESIQQSIYVQEGCKILYEKILAILQDQSLFKKHGNFGTEGQSNFQKISENFSIFQQLLLHFLKFPIIFPRNILKFLQCEEEELLTMRVESNNARKNKKSDIDYFQNIQHSWRIKGDEGLTMECKFNISKNLNDILDNNQYFIQTQTKTFEKMSDFKLFKQSDGQEKLDEMTKQNHKIGNLIKNGDNSCHLMLNFPIIGHFIILVQAQLYFKNQIIAFCQEEIFLRVE